MTGTLPYLRGREKEGFVSDVYGCVHVGVSNKPTRTARERALVPVVLGCVAAGGAALGRVGGVNESYFNTLLVRLVNNVEL